MALILAGPIRGVKQARGLPFGETAPSRLKLDSQAYEYHTQDNREGCLQESKNEQVGQAEQNEGALT